MAKAKDANGEPDRPLTPLERLLQIAIGDERVFGLETDPSKEAHPKLWELMSRVFLPGNRITTPAVVSIQLGPEGTIVRLVHREMAHQISVACPHLGDWLEAMEACLAGPHPPWMPWGRNEPKARKRKSSN